MGKIVVSENVSLDGVVQDPTGEEGFRRGGWFVQIGVKDREQWAKLLLDEALGTEVSKLKQELAGDIVVYASIPLVHTLMEHDLVDELRLTIYPVVLGAGERLFGETSDKKPMRLMNTQTVGDGLAFLTYERVQDA
jgi:dihydrofolate reductase